MRTTKVVTARLNYVIFGYRASALTIFPYFSVCPYVLYNYIVIYLPNFLYKPGKRIQTEMSTYDTLQKGREMKEGQKNTAGTKKVTDNFSLDGEPLRKLKNYVLRQKLQGAKISTSSLINDLIKNKVKELDL